MNDFIQNLFITKNMKRKIKLLSAIKEEKMDILSLAKMLEVSRDTIQKDIDYLKTYYHDLIFEHKDGHSITYSCRFEGQFQIVSQLMNEEPSFYILKQIYEHNVVSFDEIAERFFISVSTLERYMRDLNRFLSRYEMKLKGKPIICWGNELAIRCFFTNMLYFTRQFQLFSPPKVSFNTFLQNFKFELRAFSTAYDPIKVVIRFQVCISRILQGATITLSKKQRDTIVQDHHFEAFQTNLNEFAKENLGIDDFPDDETRFLFVAIKESHIYYSLFLQVQISRNKHYLCDNHHRILCQEILNIRDPELINVLSCYLDDLYILKDFGQNTLIEELPSKQVEEYDKVLLEKCHLIAHMFTSDQEAVPAIAYKLAQIVVTNQKQAEEETYIFVVLQDDINEQLYLEKTLQPFLPKNMIVQFQHASRFFSDQTKNTYVITNDYTIQPSAHTYFIEYPCVLKELQDTLIKLARSHIYGNAPLNSDKV